MKKLMIISESKILFIKFKISLKKKKITFRISHIYSQKDSDQRNLFFKY